MTVAPLRTILVDDEPRGVNSLRRLLEINCPGIDILTTCSNAVDGAEQINLLMPDLVFLDIAMPVKNGFDMLKEINDLTFEIIFVTAHNQYMVDAFHFSAIDYLLKPIDDDLLIAAVERARKRIVQRTGNSHINTLLHNLQQRQSPEHMKLCIPSLKGFQVVPLDVIVYAESSGNYTNFHFADNQVACSSRPIHDYDELLSDAGFVRIHKSILVNLLHIREYLRGEGGFIVVSTGERLEVSRRKKEAFIGKMKQYYKY